MTTPYKIQYDTALYPFKDIIKDVLQEDELEKLHEKQTYDLFEVAKEAKTIWHPKYYSNFENKVYPLYKKFLQEVIKPHFGFLSMVYQKIPTFRIHLHGNVGVGGWHKDRDYNHTQGEINCWLPFTDTFGTNTIWMESEEDKGDYKPYDVKYGEVLIFDGVNLYHGNKTNEENITRLSFDFRIVDELMFKPSEKSTLNNPTQFTIGNYFEKI
jgi:hypothetical protein